MLLIDTHTHLYASEFENDRDAMIQRAFDAGVQKLLIPNIDQDTVPMMNALALKYPGHCYPMIGLHPCSVNNTYLEKLAFLEQQLQQGTYYGIGEVGMDLHWDKTYRPQQEEALKIQAEWALQKDLPLIIHSREAFDPVVDILKPYKAQGLRGVFHCFTGSYEEALMALDLGFYLGIGGVVTFKNSGLKDILPQIPLTNLILETDSPYLAPVPHRGRRNESAYTLHVAEKLAEILDKPVEEIAEITSTNAKRLFRI